MCWWYAKTLSHLVSIATRSSWIFSENYIKEINLLWRGSTKAYDRTDIKRLGVEAFMKKYKPDVLLHYILPRQLSAVMHNHCKPTESKRDATFNVDEIASRLDQQGILILLKIITSMAMATRMFGLIQTTSVKEELVKHGKRVTMTLWEYALSPS